MTALIDVKPEEIESYWKMQLKAFAPLLARYQDYGFSPGDEPLETLRAKAFAPNALRCCFILEDGERVGGIRVKRGEPKREGVPRLVLNSLYVLPEWQGRGIAQRAIRLMEEAFPPADWMLDTIAEEPGNCHLYEKMGYRRTGQSRVINERMTLIDFEKSIGG